MTGRTRRVFRRRPSGLLLAGTASLLSVGMAATDSVWDGGGSGNFWSDAANWDTPVYPNSVDSNAVFNGAVTASLTEDITIAALKLNAGVTLSGSSVLTLTAKNGMIFTGGGVKTFSGLHVLNDGGLVEWQGTGNLYLSNGAVLQNLGTFDAQNDQELDWPSVGGRGTFDNLAGGVFRKSVASGTTTVRDIYFHQRGTLDVQAGTVAFSGTDLSLYGGSAFIGAGATKALSGTTATLQGGAVSSANFDFAGATLRGSGTLGGSLWKWTAGTWGGATGEAIEVAAGTKVALDTASLKTVSAATVRNRGAMEWKGTGNLNLSNGAVLENLGTFDAQNDQELDWPSVGGRGTFDNQAGGVFRKSVASGTTTVRDIYFHQRGTLDVQAGTVAFSGTDLYLYGGSEFIGAGATKALSGTIATLQGGAVSSANFDFAGATLRGSGTLGGSLWQWTAGTWGGATGEAIEVAAGTKVTLDTASLKTVSAATVRNRGAMEWKGTGSLDLSNGAVLENHGTFDAQNDQELDWPSVGGRGTFDNQAGGVFRKSVTLGTTTVRDINFHQRGMVEVQSGTVDFAGTVLSLYGGSEFTGGGAAKATSGTTATLQGGAVSSANFDFAGATLRGSGTLGGSLWQWTAGTWGGATGEAIEVAAGTKVAMDTASLKTVSAATVRNRGTMEWKGTGNLHLSGGAVLENNGVFNAQNDQTLDWPSTGGRGTFDNQAGGVFRKSVAFGTTTLGDMSFHNRGLIDVRTGKLLFSGTIFDQSATGVMRVGLGAEIEAAALTLAGGRLEGSGLIDANVTVGGTLAPGLTPGLLTIDGTLTMGSASRMEYELGGTLRGSEYDALNVSGTVSLNGTLSVTFISGFQNTVRETDVFMLLEAPTINGLFSNAGDGERLSTSDGFGSFLVDYQWASGTAPDRIFLREFEPIPEPATWGLLSALGLVAYRLTRREPR